MGVGVDVLGFGLASLCARATSRPVPRPLQHCVLRHRDHVVEPRFGIEIENLRGRKAPVEADEKTNLRKRRPQHRQQPRQHAHGPVGGHALPGRSTAAHRYCSTSSSKVRNASSGRSPTVVVPVEERELLRAMRPVVGRVQIDRDPPPPPPQAAPMPLMTLAANSRAIRYSPARPTSFSNREIVGCEAGARQSPGLAREAACG